VSAIVRAPQKLRHAWLMQCLQSKLIVTFVKFDVVDIEIDNPICGDIVRLFKLVRLHIHIQLASHRLVGAKRVPTAWREQIDFLLSAMVGLISFEI
jgi:hypothetical protein